MTTPTHTRPAEQATPRRSRRAAVRFAGIVTLVTVSAAVSCWFIGSAAAAVSGNRQAPWIIGRAAGTTSYLLLVALVVTGLVLSHPARSRISWPSAAARIRLHISLAMFVLAFVVLHIVVLATDSYAGVGIKGSLVPLGSTYRPVPVTLGLIGAYAGLAAGLTAALAGRVGGRLWWPIHKVAAISLILVWLHGVFAGSDSVALMVLYVITGVATVALALSRYGARTRADDVSELIKDLQ